MSEDILKKLGLEPKDSQGKNSCESGEDHAANPSAKKDPIVQIKEATFAYGRNVILEKI